MPTSVETPTQSQPSQEIFKVVKRSGAVVEYDKSKIVAAVRAAFNASKEHVNGDFEGLISSIENTVYLYALEVGTISVESIQDIVEVKLMYHSYFQTAKEYILYRASHTKRRKPVSLKDEELFARNREYFKDEIQIFQYINKYARYLEDKGRRETWEEICQRVLDYFKWHMATNYAQVVITDDEWQEMFLSMLRCEAFPSMRMMQMAGPAAKRCQICIYSCSYLGLDVWEAFSEMLYVMMQGTGGGFSVEAEHFEELPKIKRQHKEGEITHVVGDSTEGWCDALLLGMKTWCAGGDIVFDVSKVRPAGSRLKTKGGYASGPGPLIELLNFTREIMLSRQGRRLRSLDVQDISCKIGKIVQVGGVRRAAMISFSDLDDELMRTAKDGANWWETTPRAMSNNSAVYHDKPDALTFLKEWMSLAKSGSGERGIFNASAALRFSPRRSKKIIVRSNACGEINLQSRELCNLSIPVVRAHDSKDDIRRKVRIAAIFGTLQSSMTNFKYLSQKWKDNCDTERLLGVDLMGASDNQYTQFTRDPVKARARREFFRELRELAIQTNKEWALRQGINQSTAVTCIKPAGNSSVIFGCGNSITGWFSKWIIRRVRCNAIDPVCKLMIDAGVPHFPEYDDPNPKAPAVWVFEFPLKAPDGALTKDDMTTLEQLENWKDFKTEYTEHNPSCTIFVGKNEWLDAGKWVLDNFDIVGGLAFLPRSEHVYPLAPLEAITEEEYNKRVKEFPTIPWGKLGNYEEEDTTTGTREFACTGDKCEL